MVNLATKILVAIGGLASVGFGVWHFTVPKTWNWNSYIDPAATELIVAVNAINVFFSLSLVLFGLMNALLVIGGRSNRYSMAVVLAATCLLWLARVALQIARPQGSMNPVLQYAMTAAFIAVLLCYSISLGLILTARQT
ncbi:MAG TPA: hypothetical protein DCG47_03505 [Spirochaetaceae bacterium]|jgi:hypothetical protein|nr:hypothetical protein [Spirochaetaceae bacterium]